jgi:hypothetical protein
MSLEQRRRAGRQNRTAVSRTNLVMPADCSGDKCVFTATRLPQDELLCMARLTAQPVWRHVPRMTKHTTWQIFHSTRARADGEMHGCA